VVFVVDKVALRQVSSDYFGFPCPFSFHQLLHTQHLSSGAGTIGQLLTDVPSGLSLTPPQETKKTNKKQQLYFDTPGTLYGKISNLNSIQRDKLHLYDNLFTFVYYLVSDCSLHLARANLLHSSRNTVLILKWE
jgi:hypothetical protein